MCKRLHFATFRCQVSSEVSSCISATCDSRPIRCGSCFGCYAAALSRTGDRPMNATVVTASGRKPRPTMLPLLIVLFLTSYGLLTALVVRQSKTINSQRSLIHLLFKDNLHLTAKKTT